jgi:hypothetical protein
MSIRDCGQVLVVLNAPPELEEPVIDWLLARESGTGFTSFPVYGHSTDHDSLTAVEQVTGRRPRQQFQVQMNTDDVGTFMQGLRKTFGAADFHYWVMPVLEGGSVSDAAV